MTINYYSDFRRPVVNSSRMGSAFGSFDPANFVIQIQQKLMQANANNLEALHHSHLINGSLLTSEATLLHENIHWWQISGSTFGFIDALTNHLQNNALLRVLQNNAPKKLVKPLCNIHLIDQAAFDAFCIDRAINDWMDMEFNQFVMHQPQKIKLLRPNPFFESTGHSLYSLYLEFCDVILQFCSTGQLIPDGSDWSDALNTLKKQGIPDYARGADNQAVEIGVTDLMEGQARILELRFLNRAQPNRDWNDFERSGLLGRQYRKALDFFTKTTDYSIADGPLSSNVAMFLLLCDIALNPDAGYPGPIHRHEMFYYDVHPGIRFMRLCYLLAREPSLDNAIDVTDNAAYDKFSGALCNALRWIPPRQIARQITAAVRNDEKLEALVRDGEQLLYDSATISVCFLLYKHLFHMRSKAEDPAFFCWVDGFRVSANETLVVKAALDNNSKYYNARTAPFFWFESDGLIHPNMNLGDSDEQREHLMSQYFTRQGDADLLRQLMASPGEFDFTFFWNESPEMEPLLRRHTEESIGFELASIDQI